MQENEDAKFPIGQWGNNQNILSPMKAFEHAPDLDLSH
jgi:hypothetical protein